MYDVRVPCTMGKKGRQSIEYLLRTSVWTVESFSPNLCLPRWRQSSPVLADTCIHSPLSKIIDICHALEKASSPDVIPLKIEDERKELGIENLSQSSFCFKEYGKSMEHIANIGMTLEELIKSLEEYSEEAGTVESGHSIADILRALERLSIDRLFNAAQGSELNAASDASITDEEGEEVIQSTLMDYATLFGARDWREKTGTPERDALETVSDDDVSDGSSGSASSSETGITVIFRRYSGGANITEPRVHAHQEDKRDDDKSPTQSREDIEKSEKRCMIDKFLEENVSTESLRMGETEDIHVNDDDNVLVSILEEFQTTNGSVGTREVCRYYTSPHKLRWREGSCEDGDGIARRTCSVQRQRFPQPADPRQQLRYHAPSLLRLIPKNSDDSDIDADGDADQACDDRHLPDPQSDLDVSDGRKPGILERFLRQNDDVLLVEAALGIGLFALMMLWRYPHPRASV